METTLTVDEQTGINQTAAYHAANAIRVSMMSIKLDLLDSATRIAVLREMGRISEELTRDLPWYLK